LNNIHTRKKFVTPWTLPAAGAALVILVAGCAGGGVTGPISTSTPPVPSVVALMPNDHGYVRVESKSGNMRCSIAADLVACQTSADNWPRHADGRPFHCAGVTADGDFHWVDADLGALEGRIKMDYQTYRAQGWTISATAGETTFTNDRSGHGMVVSTADVQPF
jgi:hypothetical protein